jgi:hypothetical protein
VSRFYKCRVCRGTFERVTLKGRKPVACPEHRQAYKRRIDRRKKRANYARGGPVPRPLCCVPTQCAQHRQFKTFAYEWKRVTVNPASVAVLADLTETIGANGFHITRN